MPKMSESESRFSDDPMPDWAMPQEIERKFLVRGEGWRGLGPAVEYAQGYLCRQPERTVRVRIAGDKAVLTIKGVNQGVRRAEFEYSIPLEEARELLELCEKPLIQKTRTSVQFEGKIWEIDEFQGENAGLVVAEVELDHEDEIIDHPPWVGAEVSDDPRYYNSNLIAHPYQAWREQGG